MARLDVEVQPGAGVSAYSLFVDGVPAMTDSSHRGEAFCSGRCGDGSTHSLLYSFTGVPGATLGIVLRCRGREVCRVAVTRTAEPGPRRSAGRQLFDL